MTNNEDKNNTCTVTDQGFERWRGAAMVDYFRQSLGQTPEIFKISVLFQLQQFLTFVRKKQKSHAQTKRENMHGNQSCPQKLNS